MLQAALKVLLTSVLVVAVSEASKRSVLLGALLASLPLTSLLAMIWLYAETGDSAKIASLSTGIFWLVLPSLTLFLVLPWLLNKGIGFWPSLLVSCLATAAAYALLMQALSWFGIEV